MAPVKQRAAIITEKGLAFGLADVPKPGPGQILVKVVAAAQNPVDLKIIDIALKTANYGGIVGRDFAGVVEELGPDVPEGVRTVGERIAGMIRGTSEPNGTYAEYVVSHAQLGVIPVPDTWSFEEAAQLGIAPLTALQCLHQTLELPSPFDGKSSPQRDILIWGGASSVGQYSIQIAKLYGLHVFTTASPKNFELVKGLGADEVFDYRDESVVENIRKATGNALDIAIDCISEGKTTEQVPAALGDKGGKVAIILPYQSPRPDVTVAFTLAYELIHPQSNAGKWYGDILRKILATGKIKPNPVLVQPNGIAGVKEGLEYMAAGKVSGQKITYRISDTPAL